MAAGAVGTSGRSTRSGFAGDVRFNSTYAVIRVFTFDSGRIDLTVKAADADPGQRRGVFKPAGALVGPVSGFQTTKSMSGPTGQWSLNLKAYHWQREDGGQTRSIAELVKDGDWVEINVVKNGVEYHVMEGRVDSVSLHIQAAQTGAPDVNVALSGRDCGAPAEDTPLYYNPYDPTHNNAFGVEMAATLTKLAGAPHEIVPLFIANVGGSEGAAFGQAPELPPGIETTTKGRLRGKWADTLDTSRVAQTRGVVNAVQALQMRTATPLWQFAMQWANPAMNEVWFDTDVADVGPGKRPIYLNMRERPFVNAKDGDASPWFKLPVHEIGLDTVRGLNLGRGKNRINHVLLIGQLPSSFGADAQAQHPPLVDVESIARWGLRRLEHRVSYLSTASDSSSQLQEYREWLDLIVAWNALNADYWQGIIHLGEMRPEIRVGQKVALLHGPPGHYEDFPHDGGDASKAMTFYVEAVQHTGQWGGGGLAETQLMVSTGYPEDKRVAAVRAAVANFKGPSEPTSGYDPGEVSKVPGSNEYGRTA